MVDRLNNNNHTHKQDSHTLNQLNSSFATKFLREQSNKIRDTIAKLKNEESAGERWIWELMQNMMDASVGQDQVKGKITLGPGFMEFAHSGNPFKLNDLSSLFFQTSEKKRAENSSHNYQNIETTGRFGTGFIVTLLLSLKIQIKGIYENITRNGVQYQQFDHTMNRSSLTRDEMMKILEDDKQFFEKLDSHYECPVQQNYKSGRNLDTSFRYIMNENSKQVLEPGMKSFHLMIPYVLAFNPKLSDIVTFNEKNGQSEVFKVVNQERHPDISIYEIKNAKTSQFIFIAFDSQYVQIGFEVERFKTTNGYRYSILPRNQNLSCLFADFPLIGSQKFGLPFVMNSHHFWPDERRSFIDLIHDDFNSSNNKEILTRGLKLYEKVLDFCIVAKFGNIHNLCAFQEPKMTSKKDWYNTDILPEVIKFISQKKIVPNIRGEMCTLDQIKIPEDAYEFQTFDSTQQVEKLYDIISKISHVAYKIIQGDTDLVKQWKAILADPCWETIQSKSAFSIKDVIKIINSKKNKNFDDIIKLQDKGNGKSAIAFLNSVYEYINDINLTDQRKILQEYKLFINQNDQICTLDKLMIDDNIDQEYISIFSAFGFNIQEKLLLKDLDKDLFQNQLINKFDNKKVSDILLGTLQQKSSILSCPTQNSLLELALRCIKLIPRDYEQLQAYQFASENKIKEFFRFCCQYKAFGLSHQNVCTVTYFDEQVWLAAKHILLNSIYDDLLKQGSLSQLEHKLKLDEGFSIDWLNNFYQNFIELKGAQSEELFPVLLNQNLQFMHAVNENVTIQWKKKKAVGRKFKTENGIIDCTHEYNDLKRKTNQNESIKYIMRIYYQEIDSKLSNKLIHWRFTPLLLDKTTFKVLSLMEICNQINFKLFNNCKTSDGFEQNSDLILQIEDIYSNHLASHIAHKYFPYYDFERKELLVRIFSKDIQQPLLNIYLNNQKSLLKNIGELNSAQMAKVAEFVNKLMME